MDRNTPVPLAPQQSNPPRNSGAYGATAGGCRAAEALVQRAQRLVGVPGEVDDGREQEQVLLVGEVHGHARALRARLRVSAPEAATARPAPCCP